MTSIEESENHIPRGDEPRAAMEVDGGLGCQYDCEADADWLVETDHGGWFFCCQPCSQKNLIYARENELYQNDLSPEVRARAE